MSVIHCSDKPLRELRLAVLQKHGKLYGVLKQEINIALQKHVESLKEEPQ